MIDSDVTGDAQYPRCHACALGPIALARAPGLLESPGRELLDIRFVVHPITEIVVHAWQLLGEHGVPIQLGGRASPHHRVDRLGIQAHTSIYERGRPVSHASDHESGGLSRSAATSALASPSNKGRMGAATAARAVDSASAGTRVVNFSRSPARSLIRSNPNIAPLPWILCTMSWMIRSAFRSPVAARRSSSFWSCGIWLAVRCRNFAARTLTCSRSSASVILPVMRLVPRFRECPPRWRRPAPPASWDRKAWQ